MFETVERRKRWLVANRPHYKQYERRDTLDVVPKWTRKAHKRFDEQHRRRIFALVATLSLARRMYVSVAINSQEVRGSARERAEAERLCLVGRLPRPLIGMIVDLGAQVITEHGVWRA